MELTKRQQEILQYIAEFIAENRFSPSVRDIARHFSLASSGGVHKHLKMLEKKGYIGLNKNTSRSIRLLRELDADARPTPEGLIHLPLKGKVAAGAPIEYRMENETIPFPVDMIRSPAKTFVLQVSGNSMIEEHIQDGDLVLIEDRNTAANGEVVVAMIDHEEATLKKFYHEGDRIRLQPANFEMEPIYVEPANVTIQGIVVGVLRRY